MTTYPFQRHPVTLAVLTAVKTAGYPSDVCLIPKDGGWRSGAPAGPGAIFTPYSTIIPRSVGFSTGSIAEPQGDWHIPYDINFYAIRGDETELLADDVRVALAGIVGSSITVQGPSYKIQKINLAVVGQITRVDQSDPPFYIQTDTVEVWVGKELQ
jgi:hypothetical protein